jgi:HlyD family secretion protein
MADDSLFRKAALDKLASPERLDVLMQVTSPKGWIALWTIAALLVAVVVWSILGSLPERINGQGMLTGEGGLRQIRASSSGQLASLTISVNDQVTIDQQIGTLSNVSNEESVRAAERELQLAQNAHTDRMLTNQATITSLRGQRSASEVGLERARNELQLRESNFAAGIGTRNQVLAAQSEVERREREIANIDQQIRDVQAQTRASELRVQQAQAQLESARTLGSSAAVIMSTVEGKVVSVRKQPGDLVAPGDIIAEVEAAGGESTLQIVAFVPAATGQRIQPGHPAQITVAGIRREEYGFLRGTVRSVSQYAETPDAIAATMRDVQISEASYRVLIEPTPDSATPTGYAWSTGTGPHTPIAGGTIVSVEVEVDQRAPISLVLPILKSAIGA